MALSSDLISQFVKVTKDQGQTKNETTAYGKIVKHGDVEYVQLDGSDLLTPISSTTVVKDGDRVMVSIKNHTAIVTGDLTSPSANNKDVVEIGNKITEFEIVIADKVVTQDLEAINAYIENIKGITAKYEELTAITAEIETLQAKYANMEYITATDITAINAEIESIRGKFADFTNISAEDLEAVNAELTNLVAYNATFNYVSADKLEVIDANIKNLETDKLSTKEAEIKYANIDFSNIGEAAIENLFSDSGIIKDLIMSDGKVTGELVGVTIKGDLIEGNTVKADKLVIQGEDGLYYKLNVNALGETTASSDEKYQNGLDGSIIVAESITAEKIAVDDLVAFGATIGGYHITDHALYSGVKNSVSNTTKGVFLGDDGQIAVGNANNYMKFFVDENGQYKLEISASSLKLSSSDSSLEDVMNDAIINSVEEFYMSTSPTILDGGSWNTSQPEWTNGMYLWRRTLITKGDGTTSYQPSETGVCISGNSSEPVLIKNFDGKNIVLNDSSNYEVIDVTAHGESIQYVITGKNKFDEMCINMQEFWYDDRLITVENGFVMINSTGRTFINPTELATMLEPNTEYICSAKIRVLSYPSYIQDVFKPNTILELYGDEIIPVLKDENKMNWEIGKEYYCSTTFTTPENLEEYEMKYYTHYTYDYKQFGNSMIEITNIMIRLSSITDDSYEPYGEGASPSLDYPSNITNIRSFVNINIEGSPEDDVQTIYFPLDDAVMREGSYLAADGIHHTRRYLYFYVSDMNNTEDKPGWKACTQLYDDYPNINGPLSSVTTYLTNISLPQFDTIYIDTVTDNSVYLVNTGLTQTEFKTLYPNLIVGIEYELENEEVIPYTEEQLLAWNKLIGMRTYNPNTVITSNARLSGQYYTYFKGEQGKTGESENTDILDVRLTQAEATIELLSNMIANLVTDNNGGSLMTQTPDGWTFNMSNISSNLEAIKDAMVDMENDHSESNSALKKLTDLVNDVANKTAYITMSTDENGDPCIELGKSDSLFKVRITNVAIDFLEGSTKIAYANNNTFYSETIIVKNNLQIGEGPGFVWRTRANGNMGLTYIPGPNE